MKVLNALLVVILASGWAARADASTVLHNLQQINDGTSNTILLDVTGDVTLTCADGSVRSIAGDATVDCGDGSVRRIAGDNTLGCIGDGSVRTLSGNVGVTCGNGLLQGFAGDGSVRFVSVDLGAPAALCFDHARVPVSITDGSSNTIAFGGSNGLRIVPGSTLRRSPIHQIADGTSNTIFFGETPGESFCLGNTTIEDPFIGSIADGTSNTIFLGDTSRLDLCFQRARIGSIADGPSNTIQFGDVQSGVCLEDVRVGDDLAAIADLPEPMSLALLLPALGLVVLRRRD